MSKAILVVIDGCRVDTLRQAHTPAIRGLMDRGAWTLSARTVTPSVTLPVHFSIFTSMSPTSHGVMSNAGRPNVSPSAAGMFQVAKSFGKRTAMYYNWEFLRELSPPGYTDRNIFLATSLEEEGDMAVARAAADDIVQSRPDLAFLYLGCLDEAGHAHGFESPQYTATLERADAALGHLLKELEDAGLLEKYTLLVQSDHGGIHRDHATPAPEVMTVPWILAGPGIRAGEIESATDEPDLPPVTVLDTAPTLMAAMGIPAHPMWQGRVHRERLTSNQFLTIS